MSCRNYADAVCVTRKKRSTFLSQAQSCISRIHIYQKRTGHMTYVNVATCRHPFAIRWITHTAQFAIIIFYSHYVSLRFRSSSTSLPRQKLYIPPSISPIPCCTPRLAPVMNSFPTELHCYICQLACTDDGHTARFLTRVSHYFRDVSKPFQFQSLAITGFDQMLELLSRLETTPPHMRRIRHLFLSDQSPQCSNHLPAKCTADMEKSSIIRILSYAAPTLETLTFFGSCPSTSTSNIASIFGIVFPNLAELNIVGYYPFPHLPGGMPRLERLHLRGNRNPHGLLQMGNLDVACPKLTHLRISGLTMAMSFAQELEEALTSDGHALPGLFAPKLPPNIRSIVIQPTAVPSISSRRGTSSLKERVMMERLQRLASGNGKGVQYTLVESTPPECSSDAARHEWIERLAGRDGCWVD